MYERDYVYKGMHFASKLEAQWWIFFNRLGFVTDHESDYEPERFLVGYQGSWEDDYWHEDNVYHPGAGYQIDFFLPKLKGGTFIETKIMQFDVRKFSKRYLIENIRQWVSKYRILLSWHDYPAYLLAGRPKEKMYLGFLITLSGTGFEHSFYWRECPKCGVVLGKEKCSICKSKLRKRSIRLQDAYEVVKTTLPVGSHYYQYGE